MNYQRISLGYYALVDAFAQLDLRDVPVLAHASLRSFGWVEGGADTLISALLPNVAALMMPAHTYVTMITPLAGPANNGMIYGRRQDQNRMAEPFSPNMPADRLMGIVPETLRQRPGAKRSMHPILSFTGINVDRALKSQTLEEPFAPIRMLAENDGWVLLLGVDHTVNTTVHYAEKLAGRRQFIRWALTEQGIIDCPNFPGCSAGFKPLERDLAPFTREIQVGEARVRAMPMSAIIEVIRNRLARNPRDLLCSDLTCERCNELRK
ncbi:MAG: AAC(3) family N-acetyltransferase [Anaerolineales bacterium]|nr:AAC(3) family N-acetyltransferase [Anaerolineales bacterium]